MHNGDPVPQAAFVAQIVIMRLLSEHRNGWSEMLALPLDLHSKRAGDYGQRHLVTRSALMKEPLQRLRCHQKREHLFACNGLKERRRTFHSCIILKCNKLVKGLCSSALTRPLALWCQAGTKKKLQTEPLEKHCKATWWHDDNTYSIIVSPSSLYPLAQDFYRPSAISGRTHLPMCSLQCDQYYHLPALFFCGHCASFFFLFWGETVKAQS